MIIQYHGADKVEIKTKTSTINFGGDKSTINAVSLVGAGEYEVGDVEAHGFGSGAYLVKSEGLALVYLDGVTSLSQAQVEELGDVDVLFLPAKHPDLITTIDPAIVIPIGEGLQQFCKDQSCDLPIKSLKLSARDVADAERRIVVLNG